MIEQRMTTGRRALLKGIAVGGLAIGAAGRGFGAVVRAGALPFRGLFPIGQTPVDAANTIDYDGLAAQVTFLRRGRVPGLAWPQLASGWSVLSEEERLRGAKVLVDAAKGGQTSIVIGVQSPDFGAVARYARNAETIGADAIICIPPAAITDEAALLDYYQKIGRMTALPFFTQAVGKMSVELIERMYDTIPTMRYVKDESGEPLERVAELMRHTDGKVNDFSGRGAGTMITEMERGFVGACPYVSLSDVYQACWEAWHAGNHQRAFDIFGAIQAAGTMFSQSSVEASIARGIFRPGTLLRQAPPAPGATPSGRYMPAKTPDQIRRVMHEYLRPYLRA